MMRRKRLSGKVVSLEVGLLIQNILILTLNMREVKRHKKRMSDSIQRRERRLMYKFTDYYRNKVHLSFDKEPFSKNPKHVWVICRHRNRWLLTKHPTRGIEFPGGKVEEGERAETAAIREVLEETGGVVKTLEYIAQYNVTGKKDTIIKNVYFAHIGQLTDI